MANQPKLPVSGYHGGVYFGRSRCVGFGFPGSENTNNRTAQEASADVTTLWSNESYGKVQIIMQYSHLSPNPWFLSPTSPKNAHLSMVYLDFRYTLP